MAQWKIPKMTDPRGRHWDQPKNLRDRVGLYWNHVTISEQDWRSLPSYDTTDPSGVYPGKVWRCRVRDRRWWHDKAPPVQNLLCWYGPVGPDNRLRIVRMRALIQ